MSSNAPPRSASSSRNTSSRTSLSSIRRWWNRTRYQLYAPIYYGLAWPLERGRKRAIELAAPVPPERVLILGCGTGSDLRYLPDGVQVTALDAAPAMIRRTRRRAERLEKDIDARVGDAQALPFEDDSFDVALLHLILSVVPDPQAVARETARVLAPTGRATVFDKFVPQGTEPSALRRFLNPAARLLFSDLTRRLDPILSSAGLAVRGSRESAVGGLYTVALVQPATPFESR